MPDSRTPSEGKSLRIAPHLDLEHTKLTPTEVPPDSPDADSEDGPATVRDAAGNRVASRQDASPTKRVEILQFEPRTGRKTGRGAWLVAFATVALIIGVAVKESRTAAPPASWASNDASNRGGLVPVPLSPEASRSKSVQRKTDAQGRTTVIIGDNPAAVLQAFCAEAAQQERRRPVGLQDSIPRRPDVRMGLFETAAGDTRAIRIRLERGGRRWFTGDGRLPVPTEVPPVSLTRR